MATRRTLHTPANLRIGDIFINLHKPDGNVDRIGANAVIFAAAQGQKRLRATVPAHSRPPRGARDDLTLDCKRSRNDTELAICASPELTALERKLVGLYKDYESEGVRRSARLTLQLR